MKREATPVLLIMAARTLESSSIINCGGGADGTHEPSMSTEDIVSPFVQDSVTIEISKMQTPKKEIPDGEVNDISFWMVQLFL